MDAGDWIALGAGVVALISLGVSARALRHANRSAGATERQADVGERTKADHSDSQQRHALVEVLRTGRLWRNALEGLILYMGVVSDKVTVANSDAFDTYSQTSAAYQAALLHARFNVHEPDLSEVIDRLQRLSEDLTERTGRIASARRDARDHAPSDDILSAMEIPQATGVLLERLDKLTMERFTPGRQVELGPRASDTMATDGA